MRAGASQPVSDGVNANQDAPNTPYGGGADGDARREFVRHGGSDLRVSDAGWGGAQREKLSG